MKLHRLPFDCQGVDQSLRQVKLLRTDQFLCKVKAVSDYRITIWENGAQVLLSASYVLADTRFPIEYSFARMIWSQGKSSPVSSFTRQSL
jgi:hypothetical protein